jgi:gas vesicle protein
MDFMLDRIASWMVFLGGLPDWLTGGMAGILGGALIGLLFAQLAGSRRRQRLRQREEQLDAGLMNMAEMREEVTHQWAQIDLREEALAKAEEEIRAHAEELQAQISQVRVWIDQLTIQEGLSAGKEAGVEISVDAMGEGPPKTLKERPTTESDRASHP